MITWLIEWNVVMGVLLLCYKLIVGRDTFFGLHRAWLAGILVFSPLLPLLTLPAWPEAVVAVVGGTGWDDVQVRLPALTVTDGHAAQPEWQTTAMRMTTGIYLGVTGLLLLRMAVQCVGIVRLYRRSVPACVAGCKVRIPPVPMEPFSFFRSIFISPALHAEQELAEIMVHEQTHVRQWHSVDVLLAELTCMICWFNPLAWLLRREVRRNLEYLADRGVLRAGFASRQYQYHLLALTIPNKAAASLYNHFNVLPLKKRIQMMNKRNSNPVWKAKYLLSLPLVALLAMACSGGKKPAAEEAVSPTLETAVQSTVETAGQDSSIAVPVIKGPVYGIVDEMPTYPGGMEKLMADIQANLTYPQEAAKKKVEGRVVVQFVVTATGDIRDVKVIRGVGPLLDEEAVRVIRSLPKWNPGKQNGKAVNVKYTVPIMFRLS